LSLKIDTQHIRRIEIILDNQDLALLHSPTPI
jgi:hypothetical protein